jgi:hypothetical protein
MNVTTITMPVEQAKAKLGFAQKVATAQKPDVLHKNS